MTTVREALSELTNKPLNVITDETLIADLLPAGRIERLPLLNLIHGLESLCKVDLKPSEFAKLDTVVQWESVINYKLHVVGTRPPPLEVVYYSTAISLFDHYSTVRSSLTTAFLTLSAVFATYLLRYVQEGSATNHELAFSVVFFLSVVQLGFGVAALLASTWLAALRQGTQAFLYDLETGKRFGNVERSFDPQNNVQDRYFHYLSLDPTLAGWRKFWPRDWLDWFIAILVVLMQVGVLPYALGRFACSG